MQLKRRQFLAFSAMGTATAMMNTLDTFASPLSNVPSPEFKLLIFATNWGFQGSWEEFCSKIKKEGYDGAEVWYPADPEQRKVLLNAFAKHDLKFGFLIGSGDRDYQKHLQQFKASAEGAVSLNPVYINCHSGRDHFTFEQNRSFIDFTVATAKSSGIPMYHETHRSRILYSATVARGFMEKIPDLKITLDISHWCCVHESLLEDQPETVALALARTGHIHARIGHPEGPQVNDPRAPEWKNAAAAHFGWWDKVVERRRKEGGVFTMLTEFGPADYMSALPYTRQPVANQWEINVHMLETLRKRYA